MIRKLPLYEAQTASGKQKKIYYVERGRLFHCKDKLCGKLLPRAKFLLKLGNRLLSYGCNDF